MPSLFNRTETEAPDQWAEIHSPVEVGSQQASEAKRSFIPGSGSIGGWRKGDGSDKRQDARKGDVLQIGG